MGIIEVYYRVPLHYLTVFPKKKKKILGRGFIILVSFCLFCKSLADLYLKLPAGKDEHGCTKFSATLGMGTKTPGFPGVSPVLMAIS